MTGTSSRPASRAPRPTPHGDSTTDAAHTDAAAPPHPPASRHPGPSNPLIRKLEGFVPLADADPTPLERISANGHLVGARRDLAREADAPDDVILVLDGIACRLRMGWPAV